MEILKILMWAFLAVVFAVVVLGIQGGGKSAYKTCESESAYADHDIDLNCGRWKK